jgi:hypothetical protein
MDWVAQEVAGRVPLGFTITSASVTEQMKGIERAGTTLSA